MIEAVIRAVLSNFPLTFLVLGFLAAGIRLALLRHPVSRREAIGTVLSCFLLFALGVTFLYNFVMHVFFGEVAARYIGWQPSPFQAEVGFASLGFATVAILASRGGFGLRLAAIVGPACFLWGAAAGHVYQMITAHNFAPGNAGIIFYCDILVPIIGFALLWLERRAEVRAPGTLAARLARA